MMAPRPDHRLTILRLLGRAALVYALFLPGAYYAIVLSYGVGSFAAIWPANAMVLAVLLMSPPRHWPAYAAAAGAAHLSAILLAGGTPLVALGFVGSRLIEILVAAGLLHRLKPGADWLGSVRALVLFLGVVAVLGPALSATLGAAHVNAVFGIPYGSVWQSWWTGDVVAMLIVAPLLLAWGRPETSAPARPRLLEMLAIGAGFAATGIVTFEFAGTSDSASHTQLLLALPLQIWTALRLGARGATAANAFVAVVGIGGLLAASASASEIGDAADALVALKTLLAATALATLLLAAALSESRAAEIRLRDAVENIGAGFALFDADDRLVLSNSMHQQMYAESRDRLVPGTAFEDMLHTSVARGLHPDAIGREEAWIQERLHRHRNPGAPIEQDRGGGRWLLVCERRTRDGGIVGTWTDITQLKQQEQTLRDNEERLRRMLSDVEESHAQLERQSIELARLAEEAAAQGAQARAANRAKSEFLANMSHELRTPLNSVIGFAEILRTEMFGPIGTPKYRAYATDIHESATHLLNLINDLLDLSKIEAGRLELQEDDCELDEIIAVAVRLLSERAHKAEVGLTWNCAPALPLLHCDQRKVKQILFNLLSNAIKFTPAGGEIAIRAELSADDGVVLAVEDTGIGIPADQLDRVMEPFVQLEHVLSRRHAGTGLGLPLCREFARLHGGSLVLTSAVGAGTTATVTFPPERSIAEAAVTAA